MHNAQCPKTEENETNSPPSLLSKDCMERAKKSSLSRQLLEFTDFVTKMAKRVKSKKEPLQISSKNNWFFSFFLLERCFKYFQE